MSTTIYCTYLTVYQGDKLPPFYIGSTSIKNIESGYHGSVTSKKYKSIWRSELNLNPHLFDTQILTVHSTREEALEQEVIFQQLHDAINSPLYINMALANGKFINSGHTVESKEKLSKSLTGRIFTEEHRKNLSKSLKGKPPSNKGIKRSEETRKKISQSRMGILASEETKKKMSLTRKGRKQTEQSKQRWKIAYNDALSKGIDWGKNRKDKGKTYNFKHISGIIEIGITCSMLLDMYGKIMQLKKTGVFGIPKLKNNITYKGWFCVD